MFERVASFLVVAHSFATAAEFYFVECVSKRHGTRDFTRITGIQSQTPLLCALSYLLFLVIIGFPGTVFFMAKIFFFNALLSFSWCVGVFFIFLFFVILPLIHSRIWVSIWFGTSQSGKRVADLSVREFLVLVASLGACLFLGV